MLTAYNQKTNILFILWLGLIVSCGQHQNQNFGRGIVSEKRTVEKPQDKDSILLESIQVGDLNKVKDLLNISDVNSLLKNGNTPLIESIMWGYEHLIRWLVSQGAKAEVQDAKGNDAYFYAKNNPKILRLISPVDQKEQRLFIEFINNNNYNELKKMLSEGFDPNFHSEDGETPLTLSIRLNYENVIRVLLQSGTTTDPNMNNRAGESPLFLARSLGRTRIEKILIKSGAKEII